jgi:hypothetical protein
MINDKVIVGYYDYNDNPQTVLFDFKGAEPGSQERKNLVDPYERFVEALKGQGCEVHVWGVEYWHMYSHAFYNKTLRGKRK